MYKKKTRLLITEFLKKYCKNQNTVVVYVYVAGGNKVFETKLLIKKRAAPDTHGLALSVIYYTDSISSMYGIHIDLYISRWDIWLSSYTLTLFSTANLSGASRSDKGPRFMEHFSKSAYTIFDTKICLESACHWLSILLKTFFVKSPFSSCI
jgi:hypothetical protein